MTSQPGDPIDQAIALARARVAAGDLTAADPDPDHGDSDSDSVSDGFRDYVGSKQEYRDDDPYDPYEDDFGPPRSAVLEEALDLVNRRSEGRRLADDLDRSFRQALAEAIKGTGLQGHNLDVYGIAGGMPWLQVPGADGGWWIACGLSQETRLISQLWPTFLWAVYRSDTEGDPLEGSRALDVKLTGDPGPDRSGARSGRLLAAMTVAAITGSEAFTRDRAAGEVPPSP
jgi:hypothetical protein